MAAPDTPDDPSARARRPARTRRRRRFVGWGVVVVVLGLLFAAGWVGIRGLLAKSDLESALPFATSVQSAVIAGDIPAAARAAVHLRDYAGEAAALTSDPIWRAAELIPGVGANLAAVRTATAATDSVASKVISPLVGVIQRVDPTRLKPVLGAIDLAPLTSAQAAVADARQTFRETSASVAAIDTGATIGPVRNAVQRLQKLLTTATPVIDAVGNSALLVPRMLGSDGPHNYLLLVQNPAELRATGGLVGALALVTADHGKLTLVAQAAGTSMKPSAAPVGAIPAATQGLYGPLLARFIQDVNLSPDFPLAAQTAVTMWTAKYGGTVDGVITVDPVALSYLLHATGPVVLPTRDILTADNAVPLLLSQVYSRWADPERQDAFFAAAASAVFAKVASGTVDVSALVKAFVRAGKERRMLVWSAHPDEQKVLATTTLAGTLPVSTEATAALGVYFNDATGAKMDYYLSARVKAGTAVCRADGVPSSRIVVTLTNTAPAGAGAKLPGYVTGAGTYGVPPGSIRTRVAVYGAAGGLLVSTKSGGVDFPTVAGTDAQRPVSLFTVQLVPGESKTVTVDLLNVKQKAPGMTVSVTPTLGGSTLDVGARQIAPPIALECGATVN